MKEQEQLKATQLTEEVRQVKVDKHKFLGRLNPHTGHTLYEFNKVNFQLQKATFELQAFLMYKESGKEATPSKKLKVKENCFYVSALNVKNAIKQINKRFQSVCHFYFSFDLKTNVTLSNELIFAFISPSIGCLAFP